MLKIKSEMLEKSSKSHAAPQLWKMILYFIIVFAIAAIIEGIIPMIFAFDDYKEIFTNNYDGGKMAFDDAMERSKTFSSIPRVMRISLYGTLAATLTSIFYCRCIEMRSVASMGVTKKKAVPHYLLGIVIGAVIFSLVVLLSAVTGVQSISLSQSIKWTEILLFIPGWFLQGMSEEFMFRGYLLNSVGGKHSPVTALIVSSVAFSLAHGINDGFGPLVFINLALFGLFAGLYMFLTDDIWGVCAIHSVWNCIQGNFYGISVSGMEKIETVFRTTAVSDNKILTGGDFGIEGSIFTTVVLGGGCFILLKLLQKKNSEPETEKK